MTLWPDIGAYVGPTPNRNAGGMVEYRGLVLHIASGFYDGTIAWQHNSNANVSSHFIVARDGRCVQMVDTADVAWAERAGNAHWLSVELEGFAPEDSLHATHQGWEIATPQQVEVCARILAKMHAVYGVPLQLASSPSGQGLGHHSMGAESGVDWGHSLCPGVAIKAQKPAILARAIAIAAGQSTTPQGAFMAALTDEQQHDLWVWVASLVDPNTPKTGRADDRFHFPPALVELNAKVDALAAKVDALGTPALATVDTAALTAAVQSAVNAVKGSITFSA